VTDQATTATDIDRAGWIYTNRSGPDFLARIIRVVDRGYYPDDPDNWRVEVLASANRPATVGKFRSVSSETLDSDYERLG
jgi:hypothetical protein